ncbi:MAG: ATP-binding protein [Burkholderiales bacterium]
MLEFVGRSRLDREQGEMLSVVNDSTKSLMRIIDDILDVSKIEAGPLSIRTEPASLAAVMDSVVRTFADNATRKGLLLRKTDDPALAPRFLFDATRMNQVLSNLVSNAIKFTRRGRIELRAGLVKHNGNTQTIRVEVEDTGIGISADDQARLFQRFVQVEADSTTRHFGGSGLGLSIARSLAEMMGGTLTLSSTVGHGTTMTLLLQLKAVRTQASHPVRAPGDPGLTLESVKAHGRPSRLLVAEDNEISQAVVRRQIAVLGYEADVAINGEEAFRLWQARHYALVLCDCQMPVMDGYTFARKVRAAEARDPERRKVPILACTANAVRADMEASYAAGMDDVLTKPLSLAVLKEKLFTWSLGIDSIQTPDS